jgi:hypothetical protein
VRLNYIWSFRRHDRSGQSISNNFGAEQCVVHAVVQRIIRSENDFAITFTGMNRKGLSAQAVYDQEIAGKVILVGIKEVLN